MRHRAHPAVSALACCTMLLAACGDAEDAAAPAVREATPTATTPAPPAAGSPITTAAPRSAAAATAPASTLGTQVSGVPETPSALRFTAPLVGGGEVDLAGYSGQPVLFWFWAPF